MSYTEDTLLKTIKVNAEALIINGTLKGISGKVVSADWDKKELTIKTTSGARIIEQWQNVRQE